jgi:hypothetical protein
LTKKKSKSSRFLQSYETARSATADRKMEYFFKEKKRQEKEHYRIDKDKNMTTEKMKNTSAK